MQNKGFTILGMLVYATLVVMVGGIVVSFIILIVRMNLYIRVSEEVINSSQVVLAIITQEIQSAAGIYSPTSVFNNHPGQLSLETAEDVATGEDVTYVDFYLDDERLYIKREGQSARLISSELVRITNLSFNHLDAATAYPSVRIAFTMVYDSSSADLQNETQVSLTSTVSLRSY